MSGFGYDVLGFGSGGVAPPEKDDDFNRTSFLSHFDGANNGVNNAFDDGSADNLTISTAGNVTQGSFGPFARPEGHWGVVFDGAGDRVRANWSDNIASAAFTIEAWVFISGAMSQYDCIAWLQESTHGSNGDNGFCIRANNANTIEFGVFNGSTIYNTISSALSLNEWHYLTLSKSGTTMYSSVDGTVTSRSAPSALNNAKYLNIGAADANGSISYGFSGVISNVRLLKGTALYTSNFTVPTSPLTAITNTKFLGCQSKGFVDNSANNYAVTAAGNAEVSAFGPFLTDAAYDPAVNGASAYLNLSSAILVARFSQPNPPSFGPQSWTFECWFYFTGDGTYRVLLSQGHGNGTNISEFYRSSNNKLTFQVATSGDTRIIMNTAINVTGNNEWVHCALTHEYASSSNSTYKIYQNGILGQTLNHTGGYNWASGGQGYPLVIGRSEFEGQYNSVTSYVQDSRLVIGSVVYTGNFTPPTAPLTAITNTKLLLNMANGQAIDSTAQHDLTLYGNTKVSSTKAKFGDTSIYFDGTGDYAIAENFAQLKGELTIEFWVNPSGLDPKNGLFQQGLASGGLSMRIETDGSLTVSKTSVSNYFSTSTTISANAWTHIALVYYSGVLKCYINGTADSATSTTSVNWTGTGNEFILGARYASGSIDLPMTGYLDDFRISDFARYTANFTAPTKPFPDQGQV